MTAPLLILLLTLLGIVAFVLFVVFVMVPVFRGIGWIIASVFTAIGFVFTQIFEFIGGMIGDALRLVGAVVAMVILAPLAVLNVIIGRWSAAGHFADSVKRECLVAGGCLYRFFLRRPLKLFWLHGLLEGVEERVPEAMYGAPGSDKPSSRTGQFEGYEIVGSLRSGGSGGKLYIARPDDHKRPRLTGNPDHVVIKSFALTEGSSLPQIVRESRALECAKQLGHVLDHGMDEHRFFYVMPYHPGDHLGMIARQLHGETDGSGLTSRQLTLATSYIRDLVATLSHYHKGGLWHKDVKPENIIVHDGQAHLVDLGLVTPLKSAMTLTTHGTEYFRDPEMVRQALRGVKVHQVNGAKFDIYAAGAVLYFVLENTFPAHGGLSRFSARSPEALRWIVRRAMAEYNQRYEDADFMLADVELVLRASDPFALKPADLPSMRGESVPPVVETIAPPPFAASRERPVESHVAAHAHTPVPPRRPRVRVTNWWTGGYVVDDGAHPGPSSRRAHAAKRVTDARRTAREQIAAARARARELRQRAKAHRHKVGIDRQPSVALGLIVLVVLAAIFGGVYLISTSASPPSPIMAGAVDAERFPHAVRARSNRSGQTVTVEADRARASGRRDRSVAAGTVNSRSSAPPAPVTEPAAPELPYLLINDHPAKADFFVHARVQSILKDYESRGWTLLTDIDAEAEARKSLPTRAEDVKMTALLAVTLAERDLGGILYIDAAPGDAPAHKRVRVRELAVPEMATVEDPVEELVGAP